MSTCPITLLPSGRVLKVPAGTPLADALREAGVPIPLPCGGHGLCGKCGILRITGGNKPESLLACRTTVSEAMTLILPPKTESPPLVEPEIPAAPFPPDPAAGCAIDLGTTTVACTVWTLSDRRRRLTLQFDNPQRSAGDDVLSRISAIERAPGLLDHLRDIVRAAIASALKTGCGRCGIAPESISRYTVAGNPTMQQIFLGISPVPLGKSPFTPAFTAPQTRTIPEMGLPGSPDGRVTVFPQCGGFIGGDTFAGLLAVTATEPSEPLLLIDLGTNAELALVRGGRILATSAAAGPAIEGATLSAGTALRPGAITHARFRDGRLLFETYRDETPSGICGSGYIDLLAEALRHGWLTPDGALPAHDRLFISREGFSGTKPGGEALVITQQDIRQFQLAKAAIATGVKQILDKARLQPEDIRTWAVAGGLGTSLTPANAQALGLLPPFPADRYLAPGNTALLGAEQLLLHPESEALLTTLHRNATCFNLAASPDFTDRFVTAIPFEAFGS